MCFTMVEVLQDVVLQLVKLGGEDGTTSAVTVRESYVSLGPIVDFCVMDLDRQGQCQVCVCVRVTAVCARLTFARDCRS